MCHLCVTRYSIVALTYNEHKPSTPTPHYPTSVASFGQP